MGGNMQGKLWAKDEEQRVKGLDAGMDFNKVLTIDDLVASDDVFFAATGITDGDFLKGVRYEGARIYTSSLVMRSKSGSKNASVLPVPVGASTMASLPLFTTGMAASCTGVISSMPWR